MLELLFARGYGAMTRSAFVGDDGPRMAVDAQRLGGAAVAAERPGVAVTGAEGHAALEALDDSQFDMVVLRHPWTSMVGFDTVVAEWLPRLAPGGWMAVAEPALEPLLVGSAVRYPAGLWLRHLPAVADELAATLVGEIRMGPRLVAAGLTDVEIHRVDEVGESYPDAEAFWRSTRPGLPDDVIAAAAADFASLTGPIVDRRPWNVALGRRRD